MPDSRVKDRPEGRDPYSHEDDDEKSELKWNRSAQ